MQKKILIIEDEVKLLTKMVDLLSHEKYTVFSATNGADGIRLYETEHSDLILLDIMLPKIDGLEAMRRLKNKPPKSPNGPIVLLTNLGQDSIIKEGFNLGASGYLIKSSMNPDQVLSEVKVFLGKSNLPK